MRRSLLLVSIFTLAASIPAHAAWINLGNNNKVGSKAALQAKGTLGKFTVDVEIPGIEVTEVGGHTMVSLPNQARQMVAGQPELPLVTTSVMLPDRGTPSVKLVVLEEKTIQLKSKINPSKGHFTRNIADSSVPAVEGAVYKVDADFPATGFSAEVEAPYIARDVRGAAVHINPVVYNPVKNTLRVLVKAQLEVTLAGDAGVNTKKKSQGGIDAAFAPLYKSLFVNYNMGSSRMSAVNENAGRTIVICPDAWVSNIQPLLDWRATKGVETKLVKLSEVSGSETANPTAVQTKAFIQGEYDKGGLTHILLVGDGDKIVPPKGEKEKADSDACFVKLEGSDHIPDAFISRFSANTPEEVDTQVARAISYDKTPVTGADAKFYTRGVGIASAEGNPTDFARADLLRDALLAFRITSVDQIYDPGANPTKVADAVNEGRGVINYIGHGSKTMWVSSRFAVNHVAQLNNGGGKWPMIWSVACVNGDFVRGTDCFGEAWAKAGTKADPKGAIGIIAASTNMAWVPPCDWQTAAMQQQIQETSWTGAQQHLFALVKACEQWGTTTTSQGVMMIEQCIYFGDSSIQLRNDTPRTATVTIESIKDRAVTVKVLAGDKPVASARVVIRPAVGDPVVAVTGADGLASVGFARRADETPQATVTVTGPNLVPVLNKSVSLK